MTAFSLQFTFNCGNGVFGIITVIAFDGFLAEESIGHSSEPVKRYIEELTRYFGITQGEPFFFEMLFNGELHGETVEFGLIEVFQYSAGRANTHNQPAEFALQADGAFQSLER
jgi:hypothetical protein